MPKFRNALMLSTAFCSAMCAHTQTAVRANSERKQWYIDAGSMTYALGVNEQGTLQSLYYGPKLAHDALLPAAHSMPERASQGPSSTTTPQEYPAWGAGDFVETALKVNSPNGDRTLILKYDSATVKGGMLEVVLNDAAQPLKVHLYYQVYPEGVIARWSRIENAGTGVFGIENAASAALNLPRDTGYTHSWLTGMWAGEFQLHTEPIVPGTSVQESRTGHTSLNANPWFAVGKAKETTEDAGPVWFGELGWSGNWRIATETTALQETRIVAGFNSFDFYWDLSAGQSLETPKLYLGYTGGGNGEASRILSRFQLCEILPKRGAPSMPKPRPIIYNSWEATEMNFTADMQMSLAERAAKMGVERFVIDDGWFGKRDNDHAGLGDWYVTPKKFPNGLKPVIDKVHSLGMDFGIGSKSHHLSWTRPPTHIYCTHQRRNIEMGA